MRRTKEVIIMINSNLVLLIILHERFSFIFSKSFAIALEFKLEPSFFY